ncbi:kinesin-like protein KIF26A isoform X2 [Oscarella lobularis]
METSPPPPPPPPPPPSPPPPSRVRRVPPNMPSACVTRATKYLEEKQRVRHIKAKSRAVKYGYHQRSLIPIDAPPLSPPSQPPQPPQPSQPLQQNATVDSYGIPTTSAVDTSRRKAHEEGIYTLPLGTNFVNALKVAPPSAPPALVKFNRRHRGVGKVRVLLRLAKNNTESAQFLDVNDRKKQITISDPTAPILTQFRRKHVRSVAPKTFAFDSIMTSDATQTDMCNASLVEVIHSVLSGTDGCIACYGQARLGKSSIMVGFDDCPDRLGIVPTSISWLFKLIEHQRQKTKCHFAVSVSALEVNSLIDQVQDLLLDHRVGPPVSWNGVDSGPGGLENLNQTLLNVISPEGAAYYLDCALHASRQIKGIDSDDEQRKILAKFSHFCFTVHLRQKVKESSGRAVVLSSRLYLIDLASCEKPPGLSAQIFPKMKDGTSVTSLLSLGNILMAVANGEKRLTHKESKLTQLLQESLGNPSCRTNIIVHVSSLPQHYQDTLAVVQLSSRIHKMRKRRSRFSGTSSSGGESSSEESHRRRYRWRPLGGRRHRNLSTGTNSSSDGNGNGKIAGPPPSRDVISPDESDYLRTRPLLSDIPDSSWTSDSDKEKEQNLVAKATGDETVETGDTAIYVGGGKETEGEGPPGDDDDDDDDDAHRAEAYVQDGPSVEKKGNDDEDDVFLSPRHERELTAYIEKLLKESPSVPPPFPSMRSHTTSLRLPTATATANRPRTTSERFQDSANGGGGAESRPPSVALQSWRPLQASSSDFLTPGGGGGGGGGVGRLTSLLGRLLALDTGGGFAPITLSPADSAAMVVAAAAATSGGGNGNSDILPMRTSSFKHCKSEVGTASSAVAPPRLLAAALKRVKPTFGPYTFDNLSPETLDERYGEHGSPMRSVGKSFPPPLPRVESSAPPPPPQSAPPPPPRSPVKKRPPPPPQEPPPPPPARRRSATMTQLERPRSLVQQRSMPAALGKERGSGRGSSWVKSRASSVCESTAESDHTWRSSTQLLRKSPRGRVKGKRNRRRPASEVIRVSNGGGEEVEDAEKEIGVDALGVKNKKLKKKKGSWPARLLRKIFKRKSSGSKGVSNPAHNIDEDPFAESLAVREARLHPIKPKPRSSKNSLTLV